MRYSYGLTLYQFHVGAYGAHIKEKRTTLWSGYPYSWHQNQTVQGSFTIYYPFLDFPVKESKKIVCIVTLYSYKLYIRTRNDMHNRMVPPFYASSGMLWYRSTSCPLIIHRTLSRYSGGLYPALNLRRIKLN